MVLLLAAVLHCRSFGRPVGVSFSGGVAASAGGATTGQGGVTTKFRFFSCPSVFWKWLWVAGGNIAWW